jgi:hypothetical protein
MEKNAKKHILFKEINISEQTYIRKKKEDRSKKKQKHCEMVVEYE